MKVFLDTNRIKSLLDANRKTQAWLAEQVGVKPATISRIVKKNESTSYETGEAISRVLDVPFDELRIGPRYEEVSLPLRIVAEESVGISAAVEMLTTIHREDPKAWEWITGNLVMFTRALSQGGRGKKARDAGR